MDLLTKVDTLHELHPGSVLTPPPQCVHKFDEKCKEFYERIFTCPGTYRCPYGLYAYVKGDVTYTCLYLSKLGKLKSTKFKNYKFTCISSWEQIDSLIELENVFLKLHNTVDTNRQNNSTLKHDFNKLCGMMKNYSLAIHEDLQKSINVLNTSKIKESSDLAFTLFNVSTLLECRLNMIDFDDYLNSVSSQKSTSIYGKFHKFNLTFNNYRKANGRPEKVNPISGKCLYLLMIDDKLLEMLVFTIIDNACTHSNDNDKVSIRVFHEPFKTEQNKNYPVYEISNTSSYGYSDDPVNKYFEYGGKNINSIKGSGIGLYIAKRICDENNIGIAIDQRPINTKSLDLSKRYEFVVTLKFYDAYLE